MVKKKKKSRGVDAMEDNAPAIVESASVSVNIGAVAMDTAEVDVLEPTGAELDLLSSKKVILLELRIQLWRMVVSVVDGHLQYGAFKNCFLHKKYLEIYTNEIPASLRKYVKDKRNCEDIAMSFLVANETGAPPIWVKTTIHEIGSAGISSLQGQSE